MSTNRKPATVAAKTDEENAAAVVVPAAAEEEQTLNIEVTTTPPAAAAVDEATDTAEALRPKIPTPTPTEGLGGSSSKSIRITRHSSPLLLLSSPTGATTRREASDGEEPKSSVAPNIRGRKSLKEVKDVKEAKESVDGSETESQPAAVEEKDQKPDTKDKEKEKETPTCNRVTRKSHAQEQANNTRVTRNRRQSSTVAEQQQLPVGRGRARKKPTAGANPPEPAVKRKRSTEDEVEVAAKYAKVEIKDEPEEDNEVPIKQEPQDSDTTSSPAATPTPTRRGRGRPQGKSTPTPASTTRNTRLSKAGSPPPTLPKRRRIGSNTRKTASTSSLATTTTGSHGPGDEDSKDSLASSMDELLMAAAEIKQEKLIPDFEDSLMVASTVVVEEEQAPANGHSCSEPLTVDTAEETPQEALKGQEEEETAAAEATEAPSSTAQVEGKAPSLSPEMISEGVSAISVKQFYKKPEFLANNLGIEKDPELGEIVQIVSHTEGEGEVEAEPEAELEAKAETEPEVPEVQEEVNDSHSNTSLKPGDLQMEDSLDDEEPAATELETTENLVINGQMQADVDDDDDEEIEQEILKQLAKETADSRSLILEELVNAEESNTTPECDMVREEEVEEEVEEVEEEQPEEEEVEVPASDIGSEEPQSLDLALEEEECITEAVVEPQEVQEMLIDDYPEENKENVSTASTEGSHERLDDIQLTVKEDDEDEEKPLAVVAKQLMIPVEKEPQEPPEEDDEEEKPLAVMALQQKTKPESNGSPKEDPEPEPEHEQELEQRREKELHLQNLGLLTHQAAELLRQEYIQEAQTRQQQHQISGKRQATKGGAPAGAAAAGSASHVESSGTLKTVIKLNRSHNPNNGGTGGVPTGTVIHGGATGGASRKASATGSGSAHGVRRQSLKMTFQKGRARGHGAADRSHDQHGHHAEDSYYTIQNENEGATKSNVPSGNLHAGPGRKTNNRFSSTNSNNSHSTTTTTTTLASTHPSSQANASSRLQLDSSHSEGQTEHGFYQMVKKDEKEKILIPEKASSFKFHPGRLCEDQCYYCSGKFGLYDTPCHVGQIKSVERQQKILANEEKLTVDNCLCDACFRHVDRRANAPSYKKRLSAPGHLETGVMAGEKNFAGEAVDSEFGPQQSQLAGGQQQNQQQQQQRACAVKDCADSAGHSLRRKCIRKSVKKFLLNFEIPAGTSNVWLCETHYNTVIQSSGCVLCKRRLGKNHMYHITSDTDRLEKALSEMGIPVQLGVGTAVCKLCRYFANLLMKPPDSTKSQKAEFVKNYRKRLLKVHNLQDGSSNNEASEVDEEEVITKPATKTDSDATMTDSNSSSSSNTPQMSKLQAILQQNLAGEAAAAAAATADGGADISNVLRSNPNISMRELFPGEEELGVHFKVPFGCSSSQRTPEGWTRVQTFLQYDEPTRRLWEELQQPYGNQSSFLRHLILLEKYYRNGDLVLAEHASSNASVYTETVRQRLNSFDHGHGGGLPAKRATTEQSAEAATSETAPATVPATNIPLVELNEEEEVEPAPVERLSVDKLTKQLSSNAVTITARPKDKPSTPAVTTSPPPAAQSKEAPPLVPTSAANSRSILKTNLLSINKAVEIVPLSNNKPTPPAPALSTVEKPHKLMEVPKLKPSPLPPALTAHKPAQLMSSPPELISLQRRRTSAAGAPPPAAASTATAAPPATAKRLQLPRPAGRPAVPPPNVVILPETLTPQERHESKSWKPTLIPLEDQNKVPNKSHALYQTADGRRLPALVQVQSGGKPYLISIFDYNRMCILRREKLLRDQMLKANAKPKQAQTQPPPQPNPSTSSSAAVFSNLAKLAQQQTARQQLQQLQQKQQHHHQQQQHPPPPQMPNLQPGGAGASGLRLARLAPKPMPPLTHPNTQNPTAGGNFPPLLANALNSSDRDSSWLWKNFPDTNQYLLNGNASAAPAASKLPHLTAKPAAASATATTSHHHHQGAKMGNSFHLKQQQQQLHQQQKLIENAIMSKIPKSLTVIPQQMGSDSAGAKE